MIDTAAILVSSLLILYVIYRAIQLDAIEEPSTGSKRSVARDNGNEKRETP